MMYVYIHCVCVCVCVRACVFVCVCESTHIVGVQHSEELWVGDELDSRRLKQKANALVIDR